MNRSEAKTPRPQPLELGAERALVERCKAGDAEAFDRLIGAYQDSVYGLAYRLMGNYDDANDLAQEVFVVCFRKIEQFRGDSRLQTWLYRVALNLAKNTWKRRERRGYSTSIPLDGAAGGEDESNRALQAPSTAPDPRRTARAKETLEALWVCLEQLGAEQREALVLRSMEGLRYDEIAEVAGCSLGTVKSRINRARAELAKLMKDHL